MALLIETYVGAKDCMAVLLDGALPNSARGRMLTFTFGATEAEARAKMEAHVEKSLERARNQMVAAPKRARRKAETQIDVQPGEFD